MVTGYVNSNVNETKKVEKPKQFTMVKNIEGGLTVRLEAFDFSTPSRAIRFKFKEERKYIPMKWALGTFVTDPALRQMEKGLFTFENLQELIEMAEEQGFYVPDSIKEPKISVKDIRKTLKSNDEKEIKKLLMNITKKTRNDIITVARDLYDKINNNIISLIEKELVVSLKTVKLDA